MKKFLKIFVTFIFCFVSLVSVIGFSCEKNTAKNDVSDAVYYETDSNYLKNLAIDGGTKLSQYNLTNYYPLISENQNPSNFCWIYSSMKALESSFMVQTGEYYNFSEVGLAYLIYDGKVQSTGSSTGIAFDAAGDFSTFVKGYQDYGLMLESDFLNTEFQAMNSNTDTASYYSYIKKYATKKYNSFIKPYKVAEDNYYSELDTESKKIIIKNFILNYGGVFAGVQGIKNNRGCIYLDNSVQNTIDGIYNFYSYDRPSQNGYVSLDDNHAITLVGWNDDVSFNGESGAFLAMNSWGFEPGGFDSKNEYCLNSCEFFYIPYSYTYLYNTIGGFIIDTNASSDVELVSSSESSFTTDILTGSKELKNYFCYDDEISITYKISNAELNSLKIKISNSEKSFDNFFKISYDTDSSQVTISLWNGLVDFYGGYYTIDFYSDDELIAKKSLYIYSGTETGSFNLKRNDSTDPDTYALNNTFLSSNNTATLYISSSKEYWLSFNYATLNSFSKLGGGDESIFIQPIITIDGIEAVSSSGTNEVDFDDLFFEKSYYQQNTFSYRIGHNKALSEFNNSMIRFRIKISSVVYQNCYREYVINIFISELESAHTANLNLIRYELNGGQNSDENITKYPSKLKLVDEGLITERYEKIDANMTSFELKNPTKNGFEFVGWYLNSDFTGDAVTTINKLDGNIVLYAKWLEITGEQYFSLAFSVNEILDFDEQSKVAPIVYGDTIKLKIDLIENPESGIANYSYNVFYYLTYNNKVINDELLGNSQIISIGYPNLKSGTTMFSLRVVINIGSNFSVAIETIKTITVEKKKVEFSFDDLSKEYDGTTTQKPTVTATGFYEENYSSLYVLKCDEVVKNVDSYIFYIESLRDNNYYFNLDASKCMFNITQKQVTVSWSDGTTKTLVYDGKSHLPRYFVSGVLSGDSVSFDYTDDCIDAGTYYVNIIPSSISNLNYTVKEINPYVLIIEKSHVKITLSNTTDRVQTKVGRRKTPTILVTPEAGNYCNEDDLQVQIISQAFNATKSGTYQITCSVGSQNYECEIKTATYTLTGYYYIYYTLSNGTTITERVEEGQTPKGVTKEDFDAPRFSKITYSADYDDTGKDLYISVTLKDYSGVVFSAIFVGVFLIVCLIYYFKKRESKVR